MTNYNSSINVMNIGPHIVGCEELLLEKTGLVIDQVDQGVHYQSEI
jgi:hypothetical protein